MEAHQRAAVRLVEKTGCSGGGTFRRQWRLDDPGLGAGKNTRGRTAVTGGLGVQTQTGIKENFRNCSTGVVIHDHSTIKLKFTTEPFN